MAFMIGFCYYSLKQTGLEKGDFCFRADQGMGSMDSSGGC